MAQNNYKMMVPNSLTLANLACGLIAIYQIFLGDFKSASILVGCGLVFDFLDGFVARLLKVNSELGKQLDSLADMVTFGAVPGFFVFKLFKLSVQYGEPIPEFLPYIAFIIPLFSALRLAKFNLDTRQTDYFIGLPTPANTILIFSLGLLAYYGEQESVTKIIFHPFVLSGLTVITSFLLVAEIPLMSLKVKDLSWKNNQSRIILIGGIVILFFVFRLRAAAFIIPLYLILSLVFKPVKRKR